MIRRDGSEDEINPQWDADQRPELEDDDGEPDICHHGYGRVIGECEDCAAEALEESEPRADRLDDFNLVRR